MVLRCTMWACLVTVLVGLASAQQGGATPDVNTIISRIMAVRQENSARARAYTVKRNYQLLDKESQPKAQVVANITFMPPDQKQYNIESSSGGMGEKVLRDILAKETESPQKAERKEISPENYDFELLGEEMLEGRNCYVISLNPRRDEKELIRGKMWVDAATYNIHRIEGHPVKSPSWWIRDLHILMNFANVDGMWLHTSTHAVADVRFKGKYVMESHDLEYRTAETTASRQRRRNPGILAGAVINP